MVIETMLAAIYVLLQPLLPPLLLPPTKPPTPKEHQRLMLVICVRSAIHIWSHLQRPPPLAHPRRSKHDHHTSGLSRRAHVTPPNHCPSHYAHERSGRYVSEWVVVVVVVGSRGTGGEVVVVLQEYE